MKKRKGFTLIELLAVIVILGLLMAIAIPSVTKYITQSRKKTVSTTIDNYMSALTNQVNDMEYTFTATNTIYAVPIECIALERGGTNPFGKWHQSNDKYWAYVLVQYDDATSSYTYGFTFKDSAGYGLYPTTSEKLKENGSQIQQNLNLNKPRTGLVVGVTSLDNWNGFKVKDDTKIHVLDATGEGETGDGVNTCTLAQKGDNYNEIEETKIPANAVPITSSTSSEDAANILGNSAAVVLKTNVSLPSSIVLTRDVTVYSDGDYTMTFNNSSYIKGTGTMTIKSGNIKAPKEFQVTENATLVIAGGVHSMGLLSISTNGVLTINSGTISTHGYGSCGDIVMGNNAVLNVNGGKLIFNGGWDWEINLTGNNKSVFKPTNVRVNITGGEIDAVSGVLLSVRKSLNNTSNTHINISGGTFKNTSYFLMDWDAWSAVTWADGIPSITGGTFDSVNQGDYTKYIAEGYKTVTNGDGSVSIVKN